MSLLSSARSCLATRGAGAVARAGWYLMVGTAARALGRRFLQKRIYDYRMWLDLEDRGISRTLLLFGERELDHKLILAKVLTSGMTVFDVGANIGYYALMEKGLVGPAGKIIAIEPSPSNVRLLKRNLELNRVADTVVVEAAVSNRSGRRAISLSRMSNLNTFHPIDGADGHMSGQSIEVATLTVPEIAARHGRPDLIRMDVEGHEVEVLEGMLDAIRAGQMRPKIVFETHLSRYGADHDMAAVLRQLFALGYGVALAASSWQKGTRLVEARGYRGFARVVTDDVERVLFENIGNDDACELICSTGGLRTVLLSAPTA